MIIEKLDKSGAGSVLMPDLREDIADVQLPVAPHFVVRASHDGPFSLTTLALDFTLLLKKPNHAQKGWIVEPIAVPLSVGQRLGWSVLAGFNVPAVVAVLVINQKAHFLGRKEGLAAKDLWAASVVLKAHHLS